MRLTLPVEAISSRAARDFVRRLGGSIPAPVLADMELAADELVTQSLLVAPPASETLTFEIVVGREEVTIAVEDAADPLGPRPVTADDAATLGLVMVDQVSNRWGMEQHGDVIRTWASFAVSVGRQERHAS
jgi:hypothetical protein